MRKMVQIAPTSLNALEIVQADTGKSFQDLMDEAVADLLKKYKQPVTMREMFEKSAERGRRPK
jgi:hypothetical protein